MSIVSKGHISVGTEQESLYNEDRSVLGGMPSPTFWIVLEPASIPEGTLYVQASEAIVVEEAASARVLTQPPRRGGLVSSTNRDLEPSGILTQLAASQGIKPVTSLIDLRADFWPDDESIDEFTEAVRKWRDGDTSADDH